MLKLVFLLIILASPIHAAPSLMLNPDELEIANQVLNKANKETELERLKQNSIHLDAIMFLSSSDWILWVNGKRLTPENTGEYKISDVTQDSAKFELNKDGETHEFSLNINQSYIFKND